MSGEDAGHGDLFLARFLIYAGSREKPGTRSVYMQTVRRMEAYDPGLSMRRFEDITREWLSGFDRFMAQTAPSKNARNIHLRNIRAVFNEALDDELTTFYPFRKFKIRPVPTAKRSLTVEQLRMLFGYPIEDYQRKHLDMFKLSFFLVGINTVDLYNLSGITADGRIEYVRAKTGRAYSIKVEPEALEIIEKYRGEKNLLDIADTYGNHSDWRKRMNKALQKIGEVAIGKQGKKTVKPLFPHLTTYWARHTWATVAADLDIPKETIAAALGQEVVQPLFFLAKPFFHVCCFLGGGAALPMRFYRPAVLINQWFNISDWRFYSTCIPVSPYLSYFCGIKKGGEQSPPFRLVVLSSSKFHNLTDNNSLPRPCRVSFIFSLAFDTPLANSTIVCG